MDDYHAGARSQERMHEDERSERARYRSPDEERGFYSRPPSVSRSERGEREYYGAEPSRGNRSSSLEAYPRGQYSERHVETAERLQDNDIPRRFRTEHRQAYPEEPSSSDRHVGAYQLYDEGTQQTSRWDRPEVGPPREEEPTTPVPVHPQRARIFEDAPQPSMNQNTDPEFSRTSKPVRIRRPPQSSQTSSRPVETHPLPAEAQSESKKRPQADRAAAHRGEESFERPGMRRGGSLLDRLSLAPSNAATSLRDRVQLDEQGNATASLLPAGEYPGEANDAGPSDPVGRKQKRRAGKPKRGRRGGP
ncbi:hypothetical protein OE88DRAFT_403892 [Heliocybe sulcata]|uniref:Uncharacterized protein n=1 Tax=Heliocybe sulcata TaxID=5364 RepID=A0A5C3N694_9AGAM|nr:hypothetical protein OE88DRAFT_403892 [Heliocybe sulcata]